MGTILGNGLDDVWSWLTGSGSTPASGGILQQAQAANPQAAALTTPLAAPSQPPGKPPFDPMSYFQPPKSPLGILAAGLSGGFNGLANSTGYTGMAAVGQGFAGGAQGERQRMMDQMSRGMAGQQYRQGQQQMQLVQQQLIGGNIGNVFALQKVNALRKQLDPTAPELTMADLQNDPNIVTSPTGGLSQSGQPGWQGSAGPQGPAGMQPVYGGGQGGVVGVNPQVNAAYGQQAQAVPDPQQTAQAAPQAPVNPFQADFDRIDLEKIYAPEQAKVDLQALQARPDYMTWVAQNTADNSNVTPRPNAPYIQVRDGVPRVISAPSIDSSGATGYNVDEGPPGTPPTHIVTGLPTGVPESYQDAVKRNKEVQDQYAGSASAERQNVLGKMAELANGPTQYGPGQEAKAYWTAWANVIPGIKLDASDEANMEVFKKYASTLGAQYQSMLGGTGTDKQLDNSLDRIPGPGKLNEAVKELVPYLQSLEVAGQGNVNARAKWVAEHGGMPGGKSYLDFEQEWRKVYDPNVYQYLLMKDPTQKQNFIQGLSGTDYKRFQKDYMGLKQLGALPQ